MLSNKISVNYKAITLNTLLLMFICYFIFHSLSGERGIFAYVRLKKIYGEQTELLQGLISERSQLEKSVQYLHPKTLNHDFLDELARKDLGLVSAEDKIIYLK